MFTTVNFAGAATDKLWNSEERSTSRWRTRSLRRRTSSWSRRKRPLSRLPPGDHRGQDLAERLGDLDELGRPGVLRRAIVTTASSRRRPAIPGSRSSHPRATMAPGTEWPASSPNVIGVGGTSLVATSTGARASETAWAGSGGGTSQFEPKPSYQAQAVSGGSAEHAGRLHRCRPRYRRGYQHPWGTGGGWWDQPLVPALGRDDRHRRSGAGRGRQVQPLGPAQVLPTSTGPQQARSSTSRPAPGPRPDSTPRPASAPRTRRP